MPLAVSHRSTLTLLPPFKLSRFSRPRAELAIEYAIERGEFPEAFHIAEQAAHHKLPEVHLQYAMSLEDAGRFDKAEEEFLKAGKPKEAVDMYIHQHEWANAMRVAEHHEPSAVAAVREAQAREALERKDFAAAEQVSRRFEYSPLC